jgi:hypothetical protein
VADFIYTLISVINQELLFARENDPTVLKAKMRLLAIFLFS